MASTERSLLAKQIEALRKRRGSSGYLQGIQFETGQYAKEYNIQTGKIDALLNREDLSPGAKAQFLVDKSDTLADRLSGIYDKSYTRELDRRSDLTTEIDQLEFEDERLKIEEKRQEKVQKGQIFSTIGKVAGAAASFIPGVGPLVGSAITAGTDFAIGLDKSYDPATRSAMIRSGLNETLGGIRATATLAKENKATEDFETAFGLLDQYRGSDDYETRLQEMLTFIRMGKLDTLIESWGL